MTSPEDSPAEHPRDLIQTIIKLKDSKKGYTEKVEQLCQMYDNLMLIKREYVTLKKQNDNNKIQLESAYTLLKKKESLREDLTQDLSQHLRQELTESLREDLIASIRNELRTSLVEDLKRSILQDLQRHTNELREELKSSI